MAALLLLSGGFVACDEPNEKKIEIPEEPEVPQEPEEPEEPEEPKGPEGPIPQYDFYYGDRGAKRNIFKADNRCYIVFKDKDTPLVTQKLAEMWVSN